MRKIYVHTSDLDNIEPISKISKPIGLNEFVSPNQFCKLRVEDIEFHFLFGNVKNENCPWCNSEVVLHQEKVPNFSFGDRYSFYVECLKCKSRGPENFIVVNDKEALPLVRSLILQNYSERIPWDYELLNQGK